jgi:F-type H+-transporting ATPase subunit b
MSSLFIVAAAAVAEPSLAEKFGVTPWNFISQCLSFSIVCILLRKFAYRPILEVLEKRRQTIEQSMADAARIKEQLAESERRHQEILNKANADAQRMIEEARAGAQALADRRAQQAVAEAEQIIAKAHESSRLDHERMLADLKREVTRLVIDTTSKVTGKVLTPDDQRRLSEEASREIAA